MIPKQVKVQCDERYSQGLTRIPREVGFQLDERDDADSSSVDWQRLHSGGDLALIGPYYVIEQQQMPSHMTPWDGSIEGRDDLESTRQTPLSG